MMIIVLWTDIKIGDEVYGLIKAQIACNKIRKNTDTSLDLRCDEIWSKWWQIIK